MNRLILSFLTLLLLIAPTASQPAGAFSAFKVMMTGGVAQTPSAPVNSVLPVASGVLLTGTTLAVTNGTWAAFPSPTFTYQWRLNGSNITGATSQTYIVTSGDLAGPVDCVVTATNTQGVASSDSNDLLLFSPAAISGLFAWYDASNSGSITHTSGSVSQWNDLSGNGRNITQATAGRFPITGTRTINGMNAIDFVSNDYLSFPSGALTIASGQNTVFVVYQRDTTNSGTFCMLCSGSSPNAYQLTTSASGASIGWASAGTNSGVFSSLAVVADTGVTHIGGGFRGASGSGSSFVFRDGVLGSATTSSAASLASMRIGTDTSNANGHDGPIAEIVMYNRNLSTVEKNYVGNHLEAKWGASWPDLP